MTEPRNESFSERLNQVRERIEKACEKVGRSPAEVRLLAASKVQTPEKIREAADCGLVVFGENRIQEAKQKIPLCPAHLEWHLIGHLQTNKVRDAARLFQRIHSVDSQKLLAAIDAAGELTGRIMPVLLEINVSGESSKFGFAPESVPETLAFANNLKRVEIAGLMTIPPITKDPELARPFFRKLRLFRDQWRSQTGFALNELSMGMSHDFEIAVEEGAIWIRLGTVLFGSRKANEG
ncbi:MAG: YggS family pyridoxal phosphate-dependent enzyme [Kiritimatiellia bacterium]|nr:YggS family pyridoxal phosphate-dependent enzyme [Kiritimatiellia bacterium]